MKRQLTVIAILLLFTASMLSYAECWIKPSRTCPDNPAKQVERCHEADLAQPTSCGGDTEVSGCPSRRTCGKSVTSEPVRTCAQDTPCSRMAEKSRNGGDCGKKQDCGSKCYRQLPPLLADGPIRVVSSAPHAVVLGMISAEPNLVEPSFTVSPDTQPPRSIHPGIATTVLRI